MGSSIMRITDHQEDPESFYHHESSNEYCTPDKVEEAAERVRRSFKLEERYEAQLECIVALERLRYEFALSSDIDLNDVGAKVQALRTKLIEGYGIEPFDNGKVDKTFYRFLNEGYGYVDD